MKNLKLTFVSIFILAAFVSCSNVLLHNEKKTETATQENTFGAAYLCVNVGSAARTVLPENLELSNLDKFVLVGTDSSNAEKQFGEWASCSAMTSATLLCDAGVWNFKLFAYRNNVLMFTGEIQNKTIVMGNNSLNFSMQETPGVTTGAVNVTLYFPEEEQIATVKAGLFAVGSGEISGFGLTELTMQTGTGEYTGKYFAAYSADEVDAGTYFVKFYFYMVGGEQIQTPYTELVQVEGGRTSSAVREIGDVEHIYSITYDLNGGAWEAGTAVQTSLTQFETVELQNPVRNYYTFDGWYADAVFTRKVERIEIGTSGNISLYAKWKAIEYTITYELNGGTNSASNPATYTVESETITFASPTKEDFVFAGWYTDTDFTEKTTGILNGSNGDIVLYAKWCQYDVKKLADIICTLPDSGEYTLVVYGNGSGSDINAIKTALRAKTVAKFNLDLSDVEGITSISKSAFSWCSGLKSVKIPAGVTSIEGLAFEGCTSLASVELPTTLTSIGNYAFDMCSGLTFVKIPAGVTSIGDSAFSETSLESVEMPSSVTIIGRYAFYKCSKLMSVEFSNPNGWWCADSTYATSGTSISSSDLTDTATAAEYLRSTYNNYYWKRN